jgi:hypothetical protein
MSGGTPPEVPNIFKVVLRTLTTRVHAPNAFSDYFFLRVHKAKRDRMRIKKREKSHIVELEDGSTWRIWPGDIAATWQWTPSSWIVVSEIDDPYCTHALVERTSGTRARVIEVVKEQQKEIQDLKTHLEEVKAHASSSATPATKATTQ